MTAAELLRQRVLAVISAEADDTPVDQLLPSTQLRRELRLPFSGRAGLFYTLQAEFGALDETAWEGITNPAATVGAVALHVIRNVTSKATT